LVAGLVRKGKSKGDIPGIVSKLSQLKEYLLLLYTLEKKKRNDKL
jgi:hypothetical protein